MDQRWGGRWGNKVKRPFSLCKCPLEWQASGRGMMSFTSLQSLTGGQLRLSPWVRPLYMPTVTKVASESRSVMSDSLQPQGLYSPWNSPGQILEWVAFPFSMGSVQPRDQTQVSCFAGEFFTSWATKEAQSHRSRSSVNSKLTLPGYVGSVRDYLCEEHSQIFPILPFQTRD